MQYENLTVEEIEFLEAMRDSTKAAQILELLKPYMPEMDNEQTSNL